MGFLPAYIQLYLTMPKSQQMSRFFLTVRLASILTAVLWMMVCIWNWWFIGSYTTCGIGIRLMGFFLWCIPLSMVPLLFASPFGQADNNGRTWGRDIPTPIAAVLCAWIFLLGWLATDSPGACDDGDILALAGLPWCIAIYIGACVLAVLTHLLQQLLKKFLR